MWLEISVRAASETSESIQDATFYFNKFTYRNIIRNYASESVVDCLLHYSLYMSRDLIHNVNFTILFTFSNM